MLLLPVLLLADLRVVTPLAVLLLGRLRRTGNHAHGLPVAIKLQSSHLVPPVVHPRISNSELSLAATMQS